MGSNPTRDIARSLVKLVSLDSPKVRFRVRVPGDLLKFQTMSL